MDDTTDLKFPAGNLFECITMNYNVYAPSTHGNTAEMVEEFWMELENEIKETPKGSTPIVGSNINAQIGN
jgi:hypothetical protein